MQNISALHWKNMHKDANTVKWRVERKRRWDCEWKILRIEHWRGMKQEGDLRFKHSRVWGLDYFWFTLKMEAAISSEMSITVYRLIRRHVSEKLNLYQQGCDKLKLRKGVEFMLVVNNIYLSIFNDSRSQWPRGLKCGSTAARLLGLLVRIQPGAWMSFSCDCCLFLCEGLCVGMITHPEESCRLWCVWVWSWSLDNEDALAH
jgi:hypothetical protein